MLEELVSINDMISRLVLSRCTPNYSKLQEIASEGDVLVLGCLMHHVLEDFSFISCHYFGNYLVQALIEQASESQLFEFYGVMEDSLPELCKDQYGSFVVHKLVDSATQEIGKAIIENLIPDLVPTMQDQYGAFIIEKCLIKITTQTCNEAMDQIILQNILQLCKNQFSCMIVKRRLRDGSELLRNSLHRYISELSRDPIGNYVLQELVEQMPNRSMTLWSWALKDALELCTDKYGSNVIECLLINGGPIIALAWAERLLQKPEEIVEMASNEYGNYVTQRLLSLLPLGIRDQITDILISQGDTDVYHNQLKGRVARLSKMLMEMAPSQVLHKKQLPTTIPLLLERISQELTCSICLDLYRNPHITHCGHVFCGECITKAASMKSVCPLCKATCSKRMALSKSLEDLEGTEKQSSGVKSKRKLITPIRRPARRLTFSPQTTQASQRQSQEVDSQYIEKLRSVNDLIRSEIDRIDKELETIEGSQVVEISAETQKILDEIEFPSSPVIDSMTPIDDGKGVTRRMPDYTIVVTTTLLNSEEKAQVKAWTEKYGAIYSSDYNPSVTHVIAKTGDEPRLAVRSMKTMQAIVNGNWLLSTCWIQACLRSGGYCKEEPFELEGDQYSDDEGPRRSRMSHLNNESKLFDGYQFYLFGTFGSPSKPELVSLLCSAGAKIIESIEGLSQFQRLTHNNVLVVGDPNECYDLEKDQGIIEKFTFIQTEWIYASISAFEPLDYRHFSFL